MGRLSNFSSTPPTLIPLNRLDVKSVSGLFSELGLDVLLDPRGARQLHLLDACRGTEPTCTGWALHRTLRKVSQVSGADGHPQGRDVEAWEVLSPTRHSTLSRSGGRPAGRGYSAEYVRSADHEPCTAFATQQSHASCRKHLKRGSRTLMRSFSK